MVDDVLEIWFKVIYELMKSRSVQSKNINEQSLLETDESFL